MSNQDETRWGIDRTWRNPIITGIFGLIIGVVAANLQAKAVKDQYFLENRARTGEIVTSQFSRYIDKFQRLIQVQRDYRDKKMTKEDAERMAIVLNQQRVDARAKLFNALSALRLYYGDNVTDIVVEFQTWDEEQATKRISDLPEITQWRGYQTKILAAMREEIQQRAWHL